MRYRHKVPIVAILGVVLVASQGVAQDILPWRLDDFPVGGDPLTVVVAGTLIDEGELIEPTCNALEPGNIPQIASGVSGIAVSITGSDRDNAATIVEGLPYCCELLTGADADSRISLGVAIAMKARSLAESDIRSAQEMELIVAICDDDVLGRSYELARGSDDLGELIAQVGDPDDPTDPEIPLDPDPGGGVASLN